MRTTDRLRGVEPLEQRFCLSLAHPHPGGGSFHLAAFTQTSNVSQSYEHHQFTAMSRTDGFAGGGMMKTMVMRFDDGPKGEGARTRMAPPPMAEAIAKALEQLAREMMKQMEAGEGYSNIHEDGIPHDGAGGSFVIGQPGSAKEADPGTGTAAPSGPSGPNANQSGVIVTSTRPIEAVRETGVVVVPKTRVAEVATGGRAVEILETTSAVATRAVANSVSTIASIGTHATSTARGLWSMVTGGGETSVVTPASGNVIATANPAGAMAARATNAIAPNVSVPKLFEFAHLGSPMTLLADSMAGFIEDSAAIPVATSVAAQARSQMPWLITASVIAADVVLLTYMHRRRARRAGTVFSVRELM